MPDRSGDNQSPLALAVGVLVSIEKLETRKIDSHRRAWLRYLLAFVMRLACEVRKEIPSAVLEFKNREGSMNCSPHEHHSPRVRYGIVAGTRPLLDEFQPKNRTSKVAVCGTLFCPGTSFAQGSSTILHLTIRF